MKTFHSFANAVCVVSMLAGVSLLELSAIAQQAPDSTGSMHVGANVHVSKDLAAAPHGETEIAANPNDASQLVACSMTFPNDSPSSEVATYVSFDGGTTWKLALQTKGEDGYESWDPDCRFGPGHTLYSLSEGTGPDDKDGYDRVDRSNDGGKTWEAPARVIHAERSFIVVDNRPGPHNGWVYLYGMGEDDKSIRVGYSTDGGKTFFTQVVPMEKGFHDVNVGPGAILSDGSLVIPMPVMKQSPEDSEQGFRVRLPAEIHLVRVTFEHPNWPLKVEMSKIAPWFADFEPNGSYYTSLAVDESNGPFRDRIYVVWEDRSSDRSQVKLSFSTDKGKKWSHPRIMDDDIARQVGDTIRGPDDIHAQVAVNPRGVVGVMWLDRREFPDNLGWAARFRASLDGGETFMPSVKASNVDYDPGRGGRVYLFGGSGEKGPHSTNTLSIPWFVFHGGHTMGLAADANGGFHPLWIANPTGLPQLWTTDITVDGDVVKNGSPELAKLEDASKLVRLEFLNRYYDMKTHSVDFELRLENASKATIRGPLKVRVLDAGSYVGDVTIQADGREKNVEGAVWDFSSLLPRSVFQPGDVTRPIHVRLVVRGIDPFTQIGRFTWFLTPLATLTTKVLAGSIEQPKATETQKNPEE
ncbi:MAG: sialidase family protein [Terriglobia bacterium]|nr:sialidase family protein [Terriglobia bacterium]